MNSGQRISVLPIDSVETFNRKFSIPLCNDKSLEFPEILYKKKAEIGSTYSIKYLGITDGRIGILTKRVPIEKITNTKNYPKSNIKLSQDNYIKDLTKIKEISSSNCSPHHASSGNNDSNFDNEIINRKGYEQKNPQIYCNPFNRIQQENCKKQSINNEYLTNREFKTRNSIMPNPQTNISNDIHSSYKSDLSYNNKKVSATLTECILRSISEDKNHMVHTYSFPNALSAQRKYKIASESEEFFAGKYSAENIAFASYDKSSSIFQPRRPGFTGGKLPSLDKRIPSNEKLRHSVVHKSSLKPQNVSEHQNDNHSTIDRRIKNNNILINSILNQSNDESFSRNVNKKIGRASCRERVYVLV